MRARQSARNDGPAATSVHPLSPDDELILRSPVSEQRKQAFLADFLDNRRQTQTIETLFERVHAFEVSQSPPPKDVEAFGFKGILRKGPFVEGSGWQLGSTSSYANAMERHLFVQFDEALRSATQERLDTEVARETQALLDAFDKMAYDLRAGGFRPTLYVVTGDIGAQPYIELRSQTIPNWDVKVWEALRSTYHVMGMYHDCPVLDLPVATVPAVYALDLAQFASLTRYGELPEFRIEEFSEQRAREILAHQPRLIQDPPPESGLEEARIRQLQLRVGLDLWERYRLTIKDPLAAIGRPLVGPIVD
jgi:hypothetical protein